VIWMILLILFSVVLLLGLIVLVLPLRLIIHSTRNDYRLEWGNLVHTWVIPEQQNPRLALKVFFWKKEWTLWQVLAPSPKKQPPKPRKPPKSRKKKSRSPQKTWKLVRKVIRSFRVKIFRFRLDTDNYVLNAYLYPVFYFLNLGSKDWEINFQGETELDLLLEGRPIWVLWSLLRK
jgi:hypothetical protein